MDGREEEYKYLRRKHIERIGDTIFSSSHIFLFSPRQSLSISLVHQLFYSVGRLGVLRPYPQGTAVSFPNGIEWSKTASYDSGITPSVSLNNAGSLPLSLPRNTRALSFYRCPYSTTTSLCVCTVFPFSHFSLPYFSLLSLPSPPSSLKAKSSRSINRSIARLCFISWAPSRRTSPVALFVRW